MYVHMLHCATHVIVFPSVITYVTYVTYVSRKTYVTNVPRITCVRYVTNAPNITCVTCVARVTYVQHAYNSHRCGSGPAEISWLADSPPV